MKTTVKIKTVYDYLSFVIIQITILLLLIISLVGTANAQMVNYTKYLDTTNTVEKAGIKYALLEYRKYKIQKNNKTNGGLFLKGTNVEVYLTNDEEYSLIPRKKVYLLEIKSNNLTYNK